MTLERRTPLRRGAPLRSRARDALRRTPIARVSAKRRGQREERDDVRWALSARDHGRCLLERNHGTAGPCAGPWTPHHVEKAWKGSAYDLDNLLTLCAGHNTWVEDHPAVAWRLGLVQRNGDTPEECQQRRRFAGFDR